MFEIMIEDHFAAAHRLLNYHGICENQHGHNWKVQVYVQGDKLNTVRIVRIGKDAMSFKVDQKRFDQMVRDKKEEAKRLAEEKRSRDLKLIKEKWPAALTTEDGLKYLVLKKGNGNESPQDGMEVTVNYEGSLLDGSIFDSSYERGKPATFRIGKVIEG